MYGRSGEPATRGGRARGSRAGLAAAALLTLGACLAVGAENQEDRILLPIALATPLPGANGSLWMTEIWVRNSGSIPVRLLLDCSVTCPPYFLDPGASLREPFIFFGVESQPPVAYLLTPSGQAENLRVSLRIRDLSRQDQTWGTELPVVRESAFVGSQPLELLDIPLDARFRQALRIYSLAPHSTRVTVSFFELPASGVGKQVATRTIDVSAASEFFPGYAQMLDFASSVPELNGQERVYVRIESLDGTPLWAFVSVTNNETQHVTTITPR